MTRLVFVISLLFALNACDFGVNETSKKIAADKDAAAAVSLARQNGCLRCHKVTSSIVGPAWDLVSERYKDSPDAKAYLIEKVKKGGNGNWNDITGGAKMPAHETRVAHQHIEQIVEFILSLKR